LATTTPASNRRGNFQTLSTLSTEISTQADGSPSPNTYSDAESPDPRAHNQSLPQSPGFGHRRVRIYYPSKRSQVIIQDDVEGRRVLQYDRTKDEIKVVTRNDFDCKQYDVPVVTHAHVICQGLKMAFGYDCPVEMAGSIERCLATSTCGRNCLWARISAESFATRDTFS
jgi:hypothetical protein